MPHVMIANYNANPNIGLFCYANDKYCLVPRGFSSKLKKEFEEVLKVPVYEVNAAGTSLLGVFFAGNDNCLLVPEIMFESELKELEEYGINYHVVKSELTALGNNLVINNNICIASPDYEPAVLKDIEKALKIPVKQGMIAGLNTVGSLARGNTHGYLVSPDIEEFEKKFIKDNLKANITEGTLNFGSPYVSSAMICNSYGFVVGDISGGPEIQNADEALGFI
jgi:translation initiation factor 6